MPVNFKYLPLAPEAISGPAFIEQTEQAFNELGAEIDTNTTAANEALTAANNAVNTSENALSTSQTANTNANAALSAADTALSTANTASTKATEAFDMAAIADSVSQNALTTANTANTNADMALIIAQDAYNATAVAATIALIAISDTAPTGTIDEGARFFNTTDNQVYTYTDGAWSNPTTPLTGALYTLDFVLYMWDGGGMVNVAGSQWPALSMLVMPCALTGADALGWTLQGGQVTNAMIPQLYQRILAEYNAGVDLSDEVVISNIGGTNVTVTVPCRRSASTGLKIVDVSNREAVDDLYAQTGSAFYIVLDQSNAVFYLPRFNDGMTFTGDIDQVGMYGKDQIVNITGHNEARWGTAGAITFQSGAFKEKAGSASDTRPGGAYGAINNNYDNYAEFNANNVVNAGDRVQGRNVKLFVYFRTGDRVINAQDIDFGNIWTELAAINTRIDSIGGGGGFNTKEEITTSGTFTATTAGWYKVTCVAGGGGGYSGLNAYGGRGGSYGASDGATGGAAGASGTAYGGAGGSGGAGAVILEYYNPEL